MRLVIHDGELITQIIIQSEVTLEELSKRYSDAGIPHLLHAGDADIIDSYVQNPDSPGKAVVAKPSVTITGELRPIVADGADTLAFVIEPRDCTAYVMFDSKLVHLEELGDGLLEFSADHAGAYTLIITAPHPFKPTQIVVEAV